MQLPEKYKQNFDVSSEGPSSGVTSGGWENYYEYKSDHVTKINQSDGFGQNKYKQKM
jgi:hypothetical protein